MEYRNYKGMSARDTFIYIEETWPYKTRDYGWTDLDLIVEWCTTQFGPIDESWSIDYAHWGVKVRFRDETSRKLFNLVW